LLDPSRDDVAVARAPAEPAQDESVESAGYYFHLSAVKG
jgi:hypothetical protein